MSEHPDPRRATVAAYDASALEVGSAGVAGRRQESWLDVMAVRA